MTTGYRGLAGARFGVFLFLVTLFALYGNVMPFGWPGHLLGAAIGAIWAVVLISACGWLEAKDSLAEKSADASLILAIAGMAAIAGSGMIYMLVFGSVLDEPSATYAVLSAMMAPTVPYFIVLNGLLEMLVVPLMIALNWQAGGWRRWLMGAAAMIYWLMRAWTYAVFAGPRVTLSTTTLTDADMAWFRETIATDQRVYMVSLACMLLVLAALQRDLRRSAAG